MSEKYNASERNFVHSIQRPIYKCGAGTQCIGGFTTMRYINLRFTYLLNYLLTYLLTYLVPLSLSAVYQCPSTDCTGGH